MSSEIIDHHHRRNFLPAAGRDLFLPLYDPLVSLLGGDRARRDLVEQAKIEPSHRVLDVGCGTGTLVVLLKQRYPGMSVVGLDPDPKALHRAQNKAGRAGTSVQLDQGFADELPYANGSFDRVFSSFMFHHLEEQDREKMLSEVLRVLKPAGSFHLLDFVKNSENRILELVKHAGFANAKKVKDGSMLLGLLRTAYYQASK